MTTKAEALVEIYQLAEELRLRIDAIGPANFNLFIMRLDRIGDYVKNGELPPRSFDALTEACGGRINPETLTDLFDNRFADVSWETRAQYYEFMAGMTRMMRPMGEE